MAEKWTFTRSLQQMLVSLNTRHESVSINRRDLQIILTLKRHILYCSIHNIANCIKFTDPGNVSLVCSYVLCFNKSHTASHLCLTEVLLVVFECWPPWVLLNKLILPGLIIIPDNPPAIISPTLNCRSCILWREKYRKLNKHSHSVN